VKPVQIFSRETETVRIEAFSDGVFAIAITLLILQIKVPSATAESQGLGRALLLQWPSYVAFATSFFTIGVLWLNHHRLFSMIKRADHTLLLLNMAVLFGVTVVPFPTYILAEHLGTRNESTAAILYSAAFVFIAAAFRVLWGYAAARPQLLADDVDSVLITTQTRQYLVAPVLYAVAGGLAILDATSSVALNLLLAVFFAFPPWRVNLSQLENVKTSEPNSP